MEKQHYIINHKLDKFIDSSVSIPGIFCEGEQPDNKLAYGFFTYDPNSGSMWCIQVDTLKQLAKEMNSDQDFYKSLFNLKPGQKIYLQDQSLWLRIW